MFRKEISPPISSVARLGIKLFWYFLILGLGLQFILWFGNISAQSLIFNYFPWSIFLVPIVLALGIIVHEALHGLIIILFAPSGLKAVEFGFSREYLTPYCHSKEPISLLGYRICLLTPFLILGALPFLGGLISGVIEFTVWGAVFISAAAGDLFVFNLLQGISSGVKVQDHPEKVGVTILDK